MSENSLLADPSVARSIIAKHPIGRVGEPEEVTSLVLWLCSDEASFVTGAMIPVDGGMVLS
jgi:meso-butanediol dehydrogenase/(S,S)-butanediol dehydrogenase/diacetyl reductase